MKDYLEFLEAKKHSIGNFGIEPIVLNEGLFDFQKYVSEYTIRKGRCAGFLDTGTGKTLIELMVAQNYIHHTNKPVLIITPLAVAFQFLKEAEKFNIEDVEYSREGKYSKKIIVCNYERLHYFNSLDFDCVICDESSLIKNSDGATRHAITSFLRKVKYRYLFTATPSPNDFIELGTSSEALGYLGYADMLTRFFRNNEDTISPMNIGTEWVLKAHAKEDFFKWVSGWSISMRKPSDLGFDDSKFVLPELVTNYHFVENNKDSIVNGQYSLFPIIAKNMGEIRQENSQTLEERCEEAVNLSSNYDVSVYWCNLNREGDLLDKLDTNSYQLKGSMDVDEKEEMLLAFYEGSIKKLITKPKITSFGLNWQHCRHTVFFPTFSWEQYYQAIRRFWRFGQKNKVIADIVLSKGQKKVMDSLIAKGNKSNELFDKLNTELNNGIKIEETRFNKKITLPTFLK